jgi:hypothetical protein
VRVRTVDGSWWSSVSVQELDALHGRDPGRIIDRLEDEAGYCLSVIKPPPPAGRWRKFGASSGNIGKAIKISPRRLSGVHHPG